MLNEREDKDGKGRFSNQVSLRKSKPLMCNYNRRRSESCTKLSKNNLKLVAIGSECTYVKCGLFRVQHVDSMTMRINHLNAF